MERQKYYYVYYSYEEWGRGYIGKRMCRVPPHADTEYFGSFSDRSFAPTHKIILGVFTTSAEATEAEIALHSLYEVDVNPRFANKVKQSSVRFVCRGNWKGRTHSDKTKKLIRNKLTGRKMAPDQVQKSKESRKGFRWWTNGKSQTMSKLCPGDGWRVGMLQGTTKGGKWYNNGLKQIWVGRDKLPPVGSEWTRGKLTKKHYEKTTIKHSRR